MSGSVINDQTAGLSIHRRTLAGGDEWIQCKRRRNHLVRVRGLAENGGMRSKEEIRGIVTGFSKSGMRRREYCARHGVAMTTFDYWRRKQKRTPRLVQVAMEEERSTSGFALVLVNGRRIESSWSFSAADLEKLIRVAES